MDCSNNGSKYGVRSLCSTHDLRAENRDEKMEGNLRNSELVVFRILDTAISSEAVKIPTCYLLVPRGIREHMQECQEVKVEVQVRTLRAASRETILPACGKQGSKGARNSIIQAQTMETRAVEIYV